MQGKVIKTIQVTMDEEESQRFWDALDSNLMTFGTDQRHIVQEYLDTTRRAIEDDYDHPAVIPHQGKLNQGKLTSRKATGI